MAKFILSMLFSVLMLGSAAVSVSARPEIEMIDTELQTVTISVVESAIHVTGGNGMTMTVYKIPVSQINNIKNGADWVDEEGRTIPNSRLVRPADPPRSYAYCSDTKYIPDLHRMLEGVSTLYHESTYLSDDIERANM